MKADACAQIVQNESKISLIVDESTSVSKKLCLILYLRAKIYKAEPPQNIFLQLVELSNQGAEAIFNTILKSLENNGIHDAFLQRNLVAFCNDGASVMLGKSSGVGYRLKAKFPRLILWHCLNHRLELAVGDSIKVIDGFYHIQALFDKIYCCYSYSAKLQRELQEIANELEIEIKKIGRVFDVRWVVSSHRAAKALVRNYAPLYQHFKQLAESKFVKAHDRAMYKGMIKKMSTIQFVEDLLLVNTCLAELSELSETLQKRDMNVINANKHILWSINALKKVKTAVCENKFSFQHQVAQTSDSEPQKFMGIELHLYESRSGYVSFDKKRFIQALIDNISTRLLNVADTSCIKSFEVLYPEFWPEVETPWKKGEEIVKSICDRFLLDSTGVAFDFREYHSNPRKVLKSIQRLIDSVVKIIPISSSEAERGFSQMNITMTPRRNSLTINNTSALLFISVNGPPCHLWSPMWAFNEWQRLHRLATDQQSRKVTPKGYPDLSSIQKYFASQS